ncbi:MAG: hypothetical protein QN120_06395 [Armatimonadota bacterium]|nr:hypothetical protein [Armatimonadota bacterium]
MVRFFTISTASYFLGTVALLNSLWLTGHGNNLSVLDRGLSPRQRRLLSTRGTVVDLPSAAGPTPPVMLKAYPHVLGGDGTVAVIDSDIVVTDSLAPILERAAGGMIVSYIDPSGDRWFGEWQEIFGLTRRLRRQPYVGAGFVVLSTAHWPHLLRRWWELCCRIATDKRVAAGSPEDNPIYYGDQDALNALLMSEVSAGAVLMLERPAVPIWQELRRVCVLDEHRLRCVHEGATPVMLHAAGSSKVWESRGWTHVDRRDAYARLLVRCLTAPDLPLRLEPSEVPVWLRRGVRGAAVRVALSALNRAGFTRISPLRRALFAVLRIRKALRTLLVKFRRPVEASP